MNKNEIDLAELSLHLDALKMYAEKDLPSDIKEKLENEIKYVEKKLRSLND